MANENICVFCGEKLGLLRSTSVDCGNTWQPACRNCEKEIKELPELERCQRALVRGIANEPEKLRNRIAIMTEAEEHRPSCLECGGKLTFMAVQELDNSPYRDTIFKEPFEVQPAYCGSCGRYAFYHPGILRQNKHLKHLIYKDTQG